MAVTQVPTQLWAAGLHTLGPVNKPAGAKEVTFTPAAHPTTDWQTGPAGRTVALDIEFSTDSGVTWKPRASNRNGSGVPSPATPAMGHGGAFPTLLIADISADANGTQYRAQVTFSADMTTGWDIGIN